jgi:transcriptional regulator with XRE-family HTH domain
MTFADRLRTAAAGLSQIELARASGVDQGYLSRILRGKAEPSLGTLRKLAAALGADVVAAAALAGIK